MFLCFSPPFAFYVGLFSYPSPPRFTSMSVRGRTRQCRRLYTPPGPPPLALAAPRTLPVQERRWPRAPPHLHASPRPVPGLLSLSLPLIPTLPSPLHPSLFSTTLGLLSRRAAACAQSSTIGIRVRADPADRRKAPVAHPMRGTRCSGSTSTTSTHAGTSPGTTSATTRPRGPARSSERWSRTRSWARLRVPPLSSPLSHVGTLQLS